MESPTPFSDVFAHRKTLSTLCSDIIPFETRRDRTEAARAIPELSILILDPDALAPITRQACTVRGVPRAPAVQHHPFRGGILREVSYSVRSATSGSRLVARRAGT